MLCIAIIFNNLKGEKAGSETQVVLPITGHIVRGEQCDDDEAQI